MNVEDLVIKIEDLYAKLPVETDPSRKEKEEEVRQYALQYKELTGSYYVREYKIIRGCKTNG